ncbi:hypothetical protein [Phaeobacter sp. 22II1-1F12B]|uniref:hypothetical protein n=1 Tax=Phaeobacter sp. 22II1-1F12B TaxID=1317111 RepID=UPI0011867A01|nr:hypothetical protein [Phaeobacter sp. 22II1-1F12B]
MVIADGGAPWIVTIFASDVHDGFATRNGITRDRSGCNGRDPQLKSGCDWALACLGQLLRVRIWNRHS